MRFVRWLWDGSSTGARAARAALVPLSAAVETAATVRATAYRRGLLRARPLPLPSVAVGNLTVGGTGKTPIAGWIARRYDSAGLKPAILLRGYGQDETLVHQYMTPGASVVANANRHAGARAAARQGARVLVLDDAFQRLDVRADLDIALVSVESTRGSRRVLPAGPWRERWSALTRADAVVVTSRIASAEESRAVTERIASTTRSAILAAAQLQITGFAALLSGRFFPPEHVRGARLLAASGIADPASFAEQLRRLQGDVREMAWRDHHVYDLSDLRALALTSREVDHVVVTAKDAVKLRPVWPADVPEPLVAVLAVHWTAGLSRLTDALDRVIESASHNGPSRPFLRPAAF